LRRLQLLVAAGVTVAAAIGAGASSAGGDSAHWVRYETAGFSTAIPSTWRVLPLSQDGIRTQERQARAKGQTQLAAVLHSYAQAKLGASVQLVAFEVPPVGSVATDFAASASPIPTGYRFNMKDVLLQSARRAGGVKISSTVATTSLGAAVRVTFQSPKTVRGYSFTLLYTWYGFVKRRTFYLLQFRTEKPKRYDSLFLAITNRFLPKPG
jgi:hypothetical protein